MFQAKLLIDGLRDLLMSPISLVAAIAGLLTHRRSPDRYFRRLIEFGAESERWINLFGHRPPDAPDPGIDEIFRRLEQRVIDQYQRGGLTAHAKQALDRSLDHVHRQVERLTQEGNAVASHSPPPVAPDEASKSVAAGDQDQAAPVAAHAGENGKNPSA